MASTSDAARREQSVLRVCLAASAGLAALAVCWGLVSGSQVILLDGAYALIGMGLTWLSLVTSRVAASGPTARYPFGRESLTPVVVVVQCLALFGTLAYAAAESVRVILDGGGEVAGGSLLGYGLVTAVLSATAYLYVRAAARGSDLLGAEARGWLSGTVFSAVIAVGGVVVMVLQRTAWSDADRYVDSLLVLVTCALLLPQPVTMLRSAMVEILEGAPTDAVQEPVHRAIAEVRATFDLPEPETSISKVGRKMYVEVVFLDPPGLWEITDEDAVRRALIGRLKELPYELWVNVELTTDPELV